MSFNAHAWLEHAVRTSDYKIPLLPPKVEDITIPVEELVKELVAIKKLPIDGQGNAALLPARIPVDIEIPSALLNDFDAVIKGVSEHVETLHPAVRHALLAVALEGDDHDLRNKRVDQLWPLFDSNSTGLVYQPTVTWISLLRPDWFAPEIKVMPIVRGGQISQKEEQGVLTSVGLAAGKIRINPMDMFTWAKPVSLADAKIPAKKETWEQVANEAWSLPYPPVTSLWLMGIAKKEEFWDFIPVGAALFSPFYTDGEVDALVHNATQHTQVGEFFRPGNGIADIYPLIDDAVLSAQFNVAPLFAAPLSLTSLTAIGNIIGHVGAPASLPAAWINKVYTQCGIADALDLIPPYSAFSTVDEDGIAIKSIAREALDELYENNKIESFAKVLNAVAKAQESTAKKYVKSPVDAGAIGLPFESVYVPHGVSIRAVVPPAVTPSLTTLESN